MKVACFLPEDHFHAPVVLSALARIEGIRLLALLTPKIPGRGFILPRLWGIVRESGFPYLGSMIWQKAGFLLHSRLEAWRGRPPGERQFMNVRAVVKDREIPSHRLPDVNGPEAEEILREFSPDLILSVFFNQIVRRRIRGLAPQALNVHPSLLPTYRGVSPVFWILKNREPRGGATVHRLTDEVDQGEILLRTELPVRDGESLFGLYRRSAHGAAALLSENLGAILRGEISPVPVDSETPSKFGKITPRAMQEFRAAGCRFFRLFSPLS